MNTARSMIFRMLKDLGFQQKGRSKFFFSLKEDGVFFFAVDCPPGTVHLEFAFVPLFVPGEDFIPLTYGNRLNLVYQDLRWLDSSAPKDVIGLWCARAKQHILPLITSLSTVKEMNQLVYTCLIVRHGYSPCVDISSMKYYKLFTSRVPIIGVSSLDSYRLIMYGELYQLHYPEAKEAALCFLKEIEEFPLTENMKEKQRKEAESILRLIDNKNTEHITSFFKECKKNNVALFV